MDTSTFTHFCRAGYLHILGALAPQAVVIVPREVEIEIDNARECYIGVPLLHQVPWASRTFMTEDEEWTATEVKAALGGGSEEHLGESAVIACARHRGLVAVLDDRAAGEQAKRFEVQSINTMRIVANVHKTVFNGDQNQTISLVDALLDTDMRLPVKSGAELFG
jgi:predicted nucleic acid-binding protein